MKQALVGASQLAYPDNSEPFKIHPDASDYGIGAALVKKGAVGERHIVFASRLLTKAERNYSITEKECLALVWSVKKFHSYIWRGKGAGGDRPSRLMLIDNKKGFGGKIGKVGTVRTELPAGDSLQEWTAA